MPLEPIKGRPTPKRIKELQQMAKGILAKRTKTPEEQKKEELRKQRTLKIIAAVKRIIKNRGTLSNIPRYLPAEELKTQKRAYAYKRGIIEYNYYTTKYHFIQHLIHTIKKPKVRVLDVGAGIGQLGLDLETEYPYRKDWFPKVEYHGIDVLTSEQNPRVKASDITLDRLPKNTFDLIFGVHSFEYFSDKLRVITNCCDALQVFEKLILTIDLCINLNGLYLGKIQLKELVERYNPHLFVDISAQDLIIITKTKKGITFFPVRLDRVVPLDNKWYGKYSDFGSIDYSSQALESHYTTKKKT